MSRPSTPHPVNPASPRPHTPSRPTTPTPAPQPRPRLVDDVWFRLGVAAGVVGAVLLVTHYFEPFLMLAALPTRRWRAAA